MRGGVSRVRIRSLMSVKRGWKEVWSLSCARSAVAAAFLVYASFEFRLKAGCWLGNA